MQYNPTYSREEVLLKVNNTCDISELRELAWLVNEEEKHYCPAVFSEIYYHLEAKLNELATSYLHSIKEVLQVMQAIPRTGY